MLIQKNIEIIDVCLFLIKSKTLIIPDVHIGYEEALNKQGILIPRTQFMDIMKSIEKIVKETLKKHKEIRKIVIMGDLKHEFGTISETEWRQTLRFLDYLQRYCRDVVLLKGNHDNILGPIADKRNLQVIEGLVIRDVFLIHGHELPIVVPPKVKTIIIGHEHAAVSLREGPRVEKYKCFLKGKWKPKDGYGKRNKSSQKYTPNEKRKLKDDKRNFDLIVLPSFNPLIEGTDVLKEELLSPFLRSAQIKDFEVFVVGDKIYDFGKIRKMMKR